MRLSLSSFIYLNFPLAEAIRRIAQAGYDGIDIWGGRPHAYRRDLSQLETAELKQLIKDCGLTVASFIPAQFRYPTSLCSPNEVIRQDSVAYIQDSIRTAAELGAPIVSVCPGHSLFGQTVGNAWDNLRLSLEVICDFAALYGLRVALEPADRYETDIVQTVADGMRLIAELDRPNLGIVLDSGHANVCGEPLERAIITANDRLFHVHIDDNDGLRDQHLIPGQGSIDFIGFFHALEKAKYQGFIGVELGWDVTVDPDPAARQALEVIRSFWPT